MTNGNIYSIWLVKETQSRFKTSGQELNKSSLNPIFWGRILVLDFNSYWVPLISKSIKSWNTMWPISQQIRSDSFLLCLFWILSQYMRCLLTLKRKRSFLIWLSWASRRRLATKFVSHICCGISSMRSQQFP